VPDEKVCTRWSRSLDNLHWFASRATAFWVLDNSSSDREVPPLLIARGRLGALEYVHPDAFAEMKQALAPFLRGTDT